VYMNMGMSIWCRMLIAPLHLMATFQSICQYRHITFKNKRTDHASTEGHDWAGDGVSAEIGPCRRAQWGS